MKKSLLDKMQAGIFLSLAKSRQQRHIGAVQIPRPKACGLHARQLRPSR
jgi:hypothetical protein